MKRVRIVSQEAICFALAMTSDTGTSDQTASLSLVVHIHRCEGAIAAAEPDVALLSVEAVVKAHVYRVVIDPQNFGVFQSRKQQCAAQNRPYRDNKRPCTVEERPLEYFLNTFQ